MSDYTWLAIVAMFLGSMLLSLYWWIVYLKSEPTLSDSRATHDVDDRLSTLETNLNRTANQLNVVTTGLESVKSALGLRSLNIPK